MILLLFTAKSGLPQGANKHDELLPPDSAVVNGTYRAQQQPLLTAPPNLQRTPVAQPGFILGECSKKKN